MLPHQERIVEEKKELEDKIIKLSAFMITSSFKGLNADERERLYKQISYMRCYCSILEERIANF